jgi:hypothetical protein
LLGRTCFAHGAFALAAAMLERAASLRSDDFHSLVMAGGRNPARCWIERG